MDMYNHIFFLTGSFGLTLSQYIIIPVLTLTEIDGLQDD